MARRILQAHQETRGHRFRTGPPRRGLALAPFSIGNPSILRLSSRPIPGNRPRISSLRTGIFQNRGFSAHGDAIARRRGGGSKAGCRTSLWQGGKTATRQGGRTATAAPGKKVESYSLDWQNRRELHFGAPEIPADEAARGKITESYIFWWQKRPFLQQPQRPPHGDNDLYPL